MSQKKRGCDAERELLHLLNDRGFAVARIAGSGIETFCDLLAGNGKKRYAIEVKIASGNKKYLNKQQIIGLIKFANKFGVAPIVAIKFLRKGWWFVRPEKLSCTKKAFIISFEEAQKKGESLNDFCESKILK